MSPVAHARTLRGLSLQEAATQAGISVGYLRKIERNGSCASYPLARRLAWLYGCSLNLFVTKLPGSVDRPGEDKKKARREGIGQKGKQSISL